MRVVLPALALLAAALPAQRGVVGGRAVDPAGEPIAAVGVRVVESGRGDAVGGADGTFAIDVVDRASAWLELRARGRATTLVRVAGRARLGDVTMPSGAVLVGRVLDTKGCAVEGIDVVAVDQIAELSFLASGQALDVEHSARARTGPDGSFRIVGGLPSAARIVATVAPGIESAVGPVEAGIPVEIVVPVVRAVTGAVVRDDGRPVERAKAYVERDGRQVVGTRTDVDGRFALHVPDGEGHVITAFVSHGPTRTATAPVQLPPTGPVDGLSLEMLGDGLRTLRFRSVDEVSTFTVGRLFRDPESLRGRSAYLSSALTHSPRVARDGAVEIPFVPEGTPFVAELRAPGRARVRIDGRVEGDGEVRVELPVESVARGRVVDATNGDPVDGVRLWVEAAATARPDVFDSIDEPPLAEAVSADRGSFELRELGAGRWYVLASVGPGHPSARTEIVIGEGERLDGLVVRVDVGGTVRGRTRGARPGWSVRAAPVGRDALPPVAIEPDGSFALNGVPRGSVRLELLVPQPPRLGGPRAIALREVEVADDPVDVVVDLETAVRPVQGRVRVVGTPPPRGRLVVFFEPLSATSGPTDRRVLSLAGAASFVDADGGFAVVSGFGEHVPIVVDVATGVVLERLDALTVERGLTPLDLGEITVRCVRAHVRVTGPEASLRHAKRVEVDVGALFPDGIGLVAAGTPITRLWDCGSGISLARGQRTAELFLPASGARLLLRGDRYGRLQENVLAQVDVEPRQATRVDVELVVGSR